MKRKVELIIILTACALIYRQLSPSPASPAPTLTDPSIAPIPPPPGEKLYQCQHSFRNEKARALFNLAMKARDGKSLPLLEQASALEPGNASGFFELAQAPGLTADQKIQAYSRAIEIQPGFASAWNGRAWARAQSSDPEQLKSGVQDVRRALGLQSEPTFYDTRGYLLLRLGKIQEALPDVERAVREDPETPEHWEHRAEVYQALGRLKEAEKDRAQAEALR